MKKLFALIVLLSTITINVIKANEGMWLPMFIDRLNYIDMQKMGLKLTAEEIYSINNNSIKDAILLFGPGCTAELISPDGLFVTNHHCGYGYIQANSTVEKNFLKDGFWATSRDQELPNKNLFVRVLVRIEDVTAKMKEAVSDTMTEAQREKALLAKSKQLETDAVKDTYYDASVKSFFEGNEFYLFVYITYHDVRLVGTPPLSIGKFGAETDNWMWPRHTGDFSLFRIYVSPDGKPAEYSTQNIPLKPKHYLPISIKGIEKNDFSFIMGYPGTTTRYLTSFGVKQAVEKINPAFIAIREKKLAILKEQMNKSEIVNLQYSSKYAGTSNYYKFYIGQNKGVYRLGIIERKQEQEKLFQQWVEAEANRKAKYGKVLADLEDAYNSLEQYNIVNTYLREAALRGPDLIAFSSKFLPLYETLKKLVTEQDADNKLSALKMEQISQLKEEANTFYTNYNQLVERLLFEQVLKMYYTDINELYHPSIFKEVNNVFKGNYEKFIKYTFDNSFLITKEKCFAFLKNPQLRDIEKDAIFSIAYSVEGCRKKLDMMNKLNLEKLTKAKRIYMQGIMEMNSNKKMYPDANSTMRLTYGKVQDYIPRDAVEYSYYTTIDGIIEKEDDSGDYEVPAKLKELYNKKDYGRYGKNGTLNVCFITNNDITGGNSGSPVINANGELIGVAFDGNWEAMSGNLAFEPELQRTIVLDARYMLFIIDKFAGAKNIINELTIIE